jgi:Protein of unknown function DUF262
MIQNVPQPPVTQYPVNDFREWNANGQLELAPKFQRRPVWSRQAKSYLIDTILRGMPIPPVFVRLRIDPTKTQTLREVVDGQQRLRAVLEYLDDEFAVSRAHDSPFGARRFSKLPPEAQNRVLAYKFAVYMLEDVSDAEVLAIFARLNTYTLTLNAQERRNAQFFGEFKQTAYELALEHYEFWTRNRILRDVDIARMKDAELTSELLLSMIKGITETRTTHLNACYETYDDKFPAGRRLVRQFRSVIDAIGDLYPDTLGKSHFKRAPMFYSLFCAVFDALFGLPNSKWSDKKGFETIRLKAIRRGLDRLSEVLDEPEPPQKFVPFIDASQRATADVARRQTRHQFIWQNALTKS